jgi:hypothetical protein
MDPGREYIMLKTFSETMINEARAFHQEAGGYLVDSWAADGNGRLARALVVGEYADLVDAGWDADSLDAMTPTCDVTVSA